MHLVSLDIKNKDEEISQFLIIERLTMFQFILRKSSLLKLNPLIEYLIKKKKKKFRQNKYLLFEAFQGTFKFNF